MIKKVLCLGFASLVIFYGKAVFAEDRKDAAEVIKKSQTAFYYAADDMKAAVSMQLINKEGNIRGREMVMLRKDISDGGEQKYFIYFNNPGDVRGTSFMVFKYPAKDDDRYLFIPAIKLTTRIAANDKRSSFVGSDFSYEDISGRDVDADKHSLLREESFGGKDCYVVESIPKDESDYSKKISWLDKSSLIQLKEEYYDIQGTLYRVFTADEVKDINGFWTVSKRTMKNLKTGHRTEVVFKDIKYNIGLKDEIFSERYLSRPPELVK